MTYSNLEQITDLERNSQGRGYKIPSGEAARFRAESKKMFGWAYQVFTGISWAVVFFSCFMLFSWPLTHSFLHAKIEEYKAVQLTIMVARDRLKKSPDNELELRGIQQTIAYYNGWRAFWVELDRHPIIDYYIPNEIHQLEPMK